VNDRQRDYLGGLWAAYFWPSWRLTLWPDRGRATLQTPSLETSVSKPNEWDLLKHQFEALVRDESVDPDSIEKVLDDHVRRRIAELISRAATPETELGTPASSRAFRTGHILKVQDEPT
jgi:hypothetical protein